MVGTALAMILQLAIAALGTNWLLSWLSNGLTWLKWAGVAYLSWLGLRTLTAAWRNETEPEADAQSTVKKGFWISLTNPKTILFFSAFLPQFVTDAEHYLFQVALLSLVFWLLATALDSCYALLAARLRWLLQGRHGRRIGRIESGATGTLYLAASALLAGSKKA